MPVSRVTASIDRNTSPRARRCPSNLRFVRRAGSPVVPVAQAPPLIPDETIAEVLSRTDIVKLVGRTVELKKAGSLFKGLCPFHSENTPSFTVTPSRNSYRCFGCGAHGNAIGFLIEHGARSFPEAVRELAGECGVDVPEMRAESPADRSERERKKSLKRRLLDAQDTLASYYSDQLFGAAGGVARAYLQKRGVSPRAAKAFRLGWASGDKAAFGGFMETTRVDREDLAALGVLLPPDAGWTQSKPLDGGYLRFRQRLMFPVVDFRGDVTGFSGRILDAQKKTAKYINSPETPVFTKGEQLYGGFTAKSAARRVGRLIVCEGNVDVVALWEAGLEGTVAAMGTALTPQQARLVKRLADHVVCVMDGDDAGAKAAFASLPTFLKIGIQPRAVMLPEGDDPDSFVNRDGVTAFEALVDSAPALFDLFLEKANAENPSDPPGRSAALRRVAPVLACLEDELSRDLYRTRVRDVLGVPLELVNKALMGAQTKDRPAPSQPAAPPVPPPVDAFEPDFFESTGIVGSESAPTFLPPSRSISPPRFVRQLFEILLQYPKLSSVLQAREAHNFLTHPSLAGFVHGLYGEVNAGRTPNVDRLLSEMDDPSAIAFLRDSQACRPMPEGPEIEQMLTQAVDRLELGALTHRVERLHSEEKVAFAQDRSRHAEIGVELRTHKARIRQLKSSTVEGAH